SQAELNDKQESKSERPASASSDGAGLLDHLKGLYSESGIKEFRDVLAKAAGVDDKGGSETKKADALPDLSIAGAEKGGIGSGAVDKLGKHAQLMPTWRPRSRSAERTVRKSPMPTGLTKKQSRRMARV